MKKLFLGLLFILSMQVFAQSTPATKDDIKRLDEKFDLVIQQMGKQFEQVDKRFEDINKRFEDMNRRFEDMNNRLEDMNNRLSDMYNIMLFGFALMTGALAFLYRQNQAPLNKEQIISILANTDEKDKQKIRELLHI